MRKPALALAAAMLLLAACGQGAADRNGTEIPAEEGGAAEAGAAGTVGPAPENGTGDMPEEETDASGTQAEHDARGETGGISGASGGGSGYDAGDGAGNDGDHAAIAPQYRMNGAYRFVPIDESAPEKVVLLTFDDGPKDRAVLEQMLDALDKHQAKAVFFVNGYRAVKQPELLELIHERGHMIGNHSWDHINLKEQDEEAVRDQIGRVQELVKDATGVAPKLFRPPYGAGGDYVKAIAEEFGLLFTTWSNGSLDWEAGAKNKPDVVIRNVLDQLHPGANILMHELPWTAEALDELLGKIEEEGYGFLDPALIEIPAPSRNEEEANGA